MSYLLKRVIKKAKVIFSSRYGLGEVMRFEDYANLFDKNCYHIIESNRHTTVLSSSFWGDDVKAPELCVLPDMYWANIPNCRIIGNSDVILSSNGKILYDLLAQHEEYNANVTDYGLLQLFGKPHHIGKKYIFCYQRKNHQKIERGICLASNMSNNYFHFMFQVAAKMCYITKMRLDKDIPLLIDEQVLLVPQMKQIIDCLNIERRGIVSLKANICYRIDDLFVLGAPNIVIPNSKGVFQSYSKNNAFAYDKWSLDFIKTRVFQERSYHNTPPKCSKRIFLSRSNCNKRQINEEEIRPVLEKYGFEFVNTDKLDAFTQADLFNHAEHIIGASGAAFTNLVFCTGGCHVLIFLSSKQNSTCYSSLGQVQGASVLFLAGDGPVNSKKLHIPFFRVSPSTLNLYLKEYYSCE